MCILWWLLDLKLVYKYRINQDSNTYLIWAILSIPIYIFASCSCFLWFSFEGGGVVLFFMVFLWGWGSCFVFYGFPLGVGELFCFFLCFFNTVNGKLIFYRLNKLIRSARKILFVCLMVFNTTFNNISVISWRSVLLVEETGVPRKKPPTCRKLLTNFFS